MKRRILVALLALGVSAFAAGPAMAAPPATLTGEHFAFASIPAPVFCTTGGNFSFTASGVALGPYPGTYTETGSGTVSQPPVGVGTVTAFSATFTIYSPSGDVLVNGTKSLDSSMANTSFVCLDPPRVGAGFIPTTYVATIHSATINYHDEGSSVVGEVFSGPPATALIEDFVSSLVEPVPLLPTSKEQCKDGGWQNYPQFKNQGDCVSFVETGGRNPPSR